MFEGGFKYQESHNKRIETYQNSRYTPGLAADAKRYQQSLYVSFGSKAGFRSTAPDHMVRGQLLARFL